MRVSLLIVSQLVLSLWGRAASAAQPMQVWLDGLSTPRAGALRNAFFTADLVSAKQIAAADADVTRRALHGNDALRARLALLSDSGKNAIIYIRSDGRDDGFIAVQDDAGFRSTSLPLAAQPTRVQLLAFVSYATTPPTAPVAAPAPAAGNEVLASPIVSVAPTPGIAAEQPTPEPPPPAGPPWQTHVFDFSVGAGTISRKLTLQNIATGNMASYTLPAAGQISGTATIAPLWLTQLPILRDWQIYAELGGAPGFASTNPNSGGLATTHWWFWRSGLAFRFRTGDNLPTIAADIGYGGESFTFSTSGVLVSQVPSATYSMARFGGSIEQPIGQRWKLGINAGFRYVLSGGYLASRFAGTKILGYDIGGQVSAKLWYGFYATVVGGYVRYGYSFHPKQTDPYVATGATDELPYAAVRLGYQL